MSKFKLIKLQDDENPHDITRVEMTIETVSYRDLLEEFENFLKACGFVFKGQVDIVREEDNDDVD